MKSKQLLSVAVIGCIFLQSCATVFTGSGSSVRVQNGNPVNAKVYVDGNFSGTSPESAKVSKNTLKGGQTIAIKADGYKTQEVKITRKVQVGFLLLDVVCGVLPLVVDFMTGAIYRPAPGHVKYDLEKIDTSASSK